MRAALAERDLILDEVAEMRLPHKHRAEVAFRADMERHRLQHSTGPHNKLYSVANKSEMQIQIIAMHVDTAQQFAVRSGHVRAAENATVFRYNEDYVAALMKDGSAFGRAMRESVPGVVEKRGNNVIIGDRVFTPMTVV